MNSNTSPNSKSFPDLAIVGCGDVVANRHLPALAQLGWRPRVLIDRNVERATDLARRFKAQRVASNVAELGDGEVTAALIATNMASHARISLPLLRRGVHLFVEKPMATSFEDAQGMVKAAAANSAVLEVGHMRRYLFVNRWVKALIESGALGDIVGFDVREGENYYAPESGPLTAYRIAERIGRYAPAFWDADASGGGVLMETAPHALDTLLWQLGDARLVRYRDDSLGGVEAEALIELALPNGARGVVELSRTRDLRNTAVFSGSRGRIEIALHSNSIVSAEPAYLSEFELDGVNGEGMPDEDLYAADMFARELTDWARAIRTGKAPFVSGASATAAIGVIGDCYRNREPLRRLWMGSAPSGSVDGALAGKRVLVTGASGFIGGRLVEKLALEEGAKTIAAVRTFRNAARVSRLPPDAVSMRRLDMADCAAAELDGLVKGCDVVFHLARDMDAHKANEDFARLLGAACIRAGTRLAHVSSLGVYEPLPDAPLTEESPMGRRASDDKFAAQRQILRMVREDGLEATVIQPTIVYGPFSGHWTDRPADMLLGGVVALPSPGDGICNAVYVDDLAQALILAATRSEAVGETFLISGAEHPTWLDFYRAYESALGLDSAIRLMRYDDIERRIRTSGRALAVPTPQRALAAGPLRPLRRAARLVYGHLGERGRAHARRFYEQGRLLPERQSAEPQEFLPNKRLLDLYAAKCAVSIDKARRLLGYEPEFGLERGMELTADYLRWARAHRR